MSNQDETTRTESDVDVKPMILMPVFNDWVPAMMVVAQINKALESSGEKADVVMIDDGSIQPLPEPPAYETLANISRLEIIKLRSNIGHQRAIAVGLCWAALSRTNTPIIVMDADGEDAPSDVPRLLEQSRRSVTGAAVFAERSKRSESMAFIVFYHIYKLIHVLLTGRPVKVGNFSAMPLQLARRLVVISELWNHYAAAAHKARIPIEYLPLARSKRVSGKSQMNFISLTLHGLSGLAVFSETVGVRVLIMSVVSMLVVAVGLVFVFARIITGEFAGSVIGLLLAGILTVIIIQLMVSTTFFILQTLSSRDASRFLPIRDYAFFIDRVVTLK